MTRKLLASTMLVALLASCTTTSNSGTYQIANHPYRTAVNCERKAAIGQFDLRCDVPLLGYRGFNGGDVIVPQVGAPGGFGF